MSGWFCLQPAPAAQAEEFVANARRAAGEGRHRAASEWWSRAASADSGTAEYKVQLALALARAERTETAIEVLEAAAVQHPATLGVVCNLATLQARAGLHERANSAFANCLALDPENRAASLSYAKSLLASRDGGGAIAQLEGACGDEPEAAECPFLRGLALRQMGRYQDAEKFFSLAVAADPEDAEAHYQLGFSRIRRGEPAAAIQPLVKAAQLNPLNPEYYFQLGQALRDAGRVEEAKESLDRFRKLREGEQRRDRAAVLAKMAQSEVAAGSASTAIDLYREAIVLSPDDAVLRLNLALALGDSGDLSGKLGELRRARDLDAGLPEIHYELGRIAAADNDWASAEKEFRAAIALRPEYVEARHNLAVVLSKKGLLSEAEEHLSLALETSPAMAGLHWSLALVLAELGRMDDAKQSYRTALRLAPDNQELIAARHLFLPPR